MLMRNIICQMNVQVGVGHSHVLLSEDALDVLIDSEEYIPVVLRLAPYAQGVVDSALAVVDNSSEGSGIFQNALYTACSTQSLQNLLRLLGVSGGDGHVHTAGAGNGEVDDLCSDDSAVGDGSDLVVGGSQLGVAHADLQDSALLTCDFHEVAGLEGLGGQQSQTADHVGQQILDGQGDSQGQHAGQGHNAGHIDAQLGGNDQSEQQDQDSLDDGADQTVAGLFQLGLGQQLGNQLVQQDDDNQTDNSQDHCGQQVAQGEVASLDQVRTEPVFQVHEKILHM